MSDPMTMKWAIVDLLKICDAAHEGRLHSDLARIAATLGVTLSEPASVRAEPPLDELTAAGINFSKAKKAAKGVN